jgi:CRP-like cAMP-binding protein/Fe-S-cluster-containing hydrogenase component 2/thioredoxin reductase
MGEHFKIAVIGSGPGGLSAAARAAEHDVSHILVERAPHCSDTIFKYQKGKFVMATPDVLPLRSSLSFEAGTRERVLEAWDEGVAGLGVNLRLNTEVTGIRLENGAFDISLADQDPITADHVVLAIGLQGNLRKMGVPGAEEHLVQYQLDDPKEYMDETILVIGAGDAAIENAVALAEQNNVTIVNRRGEFARAKTGNLSLITKSIDDGVLQCMYNSSPIRVEPDRIVLKTEDGEAEVKCDRVIARLGAFPPRKFVEDCGIAFSSDDRAALPELGSHYDSNVPGLHIIGALGGFPLIKQAMNQGYEVVEYILGNDIKPADEPLLEEKFKVIGDGVSVDQVLATIRENVPLLSELTSIQLREFLSDSTIHSKRAGETIFKRNDYTNSFFTIIEGTVEIAVDPEKPDDRVTLGTGEFFGEIGLISGRRRSATVTSGTASFLIETPRRSVIKLMNSVNSVKRRMDEVAVARQIQTQLAPDVSMEDLAEIVHSATIEQFSASEILMKEGEPGDSLHLIRSGSVTISRNIGGRDVVLSYVTAGNYIGEMALLSNAPRAATVRAAVAAETVKIDGAAFMSLLSARPDLRRQIETKLQSRLIDNVAMESRPEAGSIIDYLVGEGIGEATDVLLIDDALCIHCYNCEKACAATHGGTSRLDLEAGPTLATLHVPTSCRHCEHPHCMTDCPSDSIHRAPNGEVYINDNCIGCGNCQRNCPYGVIRMSAGGASKPGLLMSLLFGLGEQPETNGSAETGQGDGAQKTAVKCDMCKDIRGGAACVRQCPTGAALRVSPQDFLSIVSLGK